MPGAYFIALLMSTNSIHKCSIYSMTGLVKIIISFKCQKINTEWRINLSLFKGRVTVFFCNNQTAVVLPATFKPLKHSNSGSRWATEVQKKMENHQNSISKMMGTLIHGQLYTFSYRAALLWPRRLPKIRLWAKNMKFSKIKKIARTIKTIKLLKKKSIFSL